MEQKKAKKMSIRKKMKSSLKKKRVKNRKNLCLNCENNQFPSIWKEFRESLEFSDGVVILPSGTKFQVHRAILSASSSFFKAKFIYNDSKSDVDGSTINIDVTDEIMNSCLDYAYTGTCSITWDNVEDLLKAADYYDIVGIIELCCIFLLKELKANNCVGIYITAKDYSCKELEKAAKTFILNSFLDVVKESDELQEICFDDIHDILSDDYLNVNKEEIVFDVIKNWIEFNIEDRSIFLPKLLNCIRFSSKDCELYQEKFMSWSPIKNNPQCQEVILQLEYKPRVPYEILIVIGGWAQGTPSNIIEAYDPRADIWLRMPFTDLRRAYHGMCTIDQKVYVIGGFDGNIHFNSMRCFDPIKYEWEEKACMYQARCYVSVVVLDSKIYAIGGFNGYSRLDSVERYDPERNQWEMIAPLCRLRSDAGAAVLHDNIYVAGGFNGIDILNSCEMYNPVTNMWTLISFMLCPRTGMSLVACHDYIYAIGGFNGNRRLTSVERYSPKDAMWSFTAEMMVPRSNFACIEFENSIYAIGGFNGTCTINFVERYDYQRNHWVIGKKMQVNRSAHSACILKGLPNIKEYTTHSKLIHDSFMSKSSDEEISSNGEEIVESDEFVDLDNLRWEQDAPEPHFD